MTFDGQSTSTTTTLLDEWSDLLDALEERTRRMRALAEGHQVDIPPVALVSPGPIPPELAVRARTLLDQMVEGERALRARRGQLDRQRRYAAG